MLSYKRFVAYIYEYQDNQKGKNRGYVKVEVKNGHCYMNYHLRNLDVMNENMKVYGFIRSEEKLEGVFLDVAPIKEHSLDFSMDMDQNALGNTEYGLEHLSGIIILGESTRYGTQWDDKPINFNLFKVMDTVESKDVHDKEVEGDGADTEQKLEQGENVEAASVSQDEIEEEVAVSNAELESQEIIEEQEKRHRMFTCIHQEEVHKMKEKWAELIAEFPPLEPFEDGGLVECIKITPTDLTRLQRQDWVLGNNSFLLHGYYNYHYLILGRVEDKDCYVLGVPGVFDHQERFMATMFGFPNFKAEKESKLKMGQFGYWYRPIY